MNLQLCCVISTKTVLYSITVYSILITNEVETARLSLGLKSAILWNPLSTAKDRRKERAGFCCIADTKDLANNALNVSRVNLKNAFMRN